MEKTSLLEQLNETKAALKEKSGKVERMQDGLKKLNIQVPANKDPGREGKHIKNRKRTTEE